MASGELLPSNKIHETKWNHRYDQCKHESNKPHNYRISIHVLCNAAVNTGIIFFARDRVRFISFSMVIGRGVTVLDRLRDVPKAMLFNFTDLTKEPKGRQVLSGVL